MKLYIVIALCLLTVQTVFANPKQSLNERRLQILKERREKHAQEEKKIGFYEKSQFDIVSLEFPAKDASAKFLLKAPSNLEIQTISYRLHNSTDLLEKNKEFTLAKFKDGPNGKELHVPMANHPSGFYKLYVKVKTKEDKDKDHYYRSPYSEYVKFAYEKSAGEVPAPDPDLNDSTLLGIDSDNNGVRDDVQLWANKTYDPKVYPSINNALKQTARYYQLFLLNAYNEAEAMPYYIKALESMQCLSWIRSNGYMIHKEMKSLALNTPERIKAYLKVDSYRVGKGVPESIKRLEVDESNQLCEFQATKE